MLPLQQKFPLVCYEKAMKKDTIREGPTIVLKVRLGRTQGLTVLPENLIGKRETQENDLYVKTYLKVRLKFLLSRRSSTASTGSLMLNMVFHLPLR